MRTEHYWKQVLSTKTPNLFIFFDTESRPQRPGDRDDLESHTLMLGWARFVRLENSRIRKDEWFSFDRADQFWRWVERHISKQRPLYIFAHNIGFDLTISDGWKFVFNEENVIKKFIFENGVFFCKLVTPKGRVFLVDSFNYYKCSLATMGKAVGCPKLQMPEGTATPAQWSNYCRNDVLVLAESVLALVRFIRTHDLGNLSPTIASLAFGGFRRRFMEHEVLVHSNERLLRLERAAYYGGIVATPFIGQCPASPIYELDVNSMYPFQCTKPLPHKPLGFNWHPKLNELVDVLGKYMCVARVTIRSDDRTYPKREGVNVYYPTGRYETVLAHPELESAVAHGDVAEVHELAYYESAPIFKRYVDMFSVLKNQYEKDGNEAFRTISKYYMNTLYGKTAQMSEKWMSLDPENMPEIEERLCVPRFSLQFLVHTLDLYTMLEQHVPVPRLGRTLRIRNIWGTPEIWTGVGESRDSVPIIAATITSYARRTLRFYQEVAGNRNWFYSDTDSIWVNANGMSSLNDRGFIVEGEFGKLAVKGQFERLTVHGRKDYQADGVVKMKGIRKTAEQIDETTFAQWHFPSVMAILKSGALDSVTIKRVVKHLRRNVNYCTVGADGWTKPLLRLS